ncbi:MAG: iron ABC transporter permease [Clostridiales bacterium]|nr:iron ABC transporter permease [Clostridiales bacterium]
MSELNQKALPLLTFATCVVFLICVCVGSVNIPLPDTLSALFGVYVENTVHANIIQNVRTPRVICVALTGAALSLCGAAMQGLLRNPLADGSTLGVSGGAALGAVASMVLGINIPGLPFAGTTVMAILFAFLSLLIILGLTFKVDHTFSTNTIILMGVVFSMFASSMISLMIAFAGENITSVTFWMMGSLEGSDLTDILLLGAALLSCGIVILFLSSELNAFAVGEDNARHVGVNVRLVKLEILIAVSILIGVCVSIGGSIGFVGLIIPHMTRLLVGPNHKKLLPRCLFLGAIFLMLSDLLCRVILRPIELRIGIITSIAGSVTFVFIFINSRKN